MHTTPHSDETKRKISLKKKGKVSNRKGVILSLETRKKISEAKKGFTHSEEVKQQMSDNRKGEKNHFYGKTHQSISLKKMSDAKIGKRPPNYIEDRTKVKLDKERGGPLHKEWSKSVKNRDNWTCRLLDKTCDGKVVAHHIYPWANYPDLRYKIKNGITLCRVHHPRKRIDEQRMIPTFIEMVSAIKCI